MKIITRPKELELLNRYSCKRVEKVYLSKTLQTFQNHFNDSLLNHTETNSWVQEWACLYPYTDATKILYLMALNSFLEWLLKERLIQGNIFSFLFLNRAVVGQDVILKLPQGWHRLCCDYLTCEVLVDETRKNYKTEMLRYTRYMAQQAGSEYFSIEDACSQELITSFFIEMAHSHTYGTCYKAFPLLKNFMDYLKKTKHLINNPMRTLLCKHGCTEQNFLLTASALSP